MILPAPFTDNRELDFFLNAIRDYLNLLESKTGAPAAIADGGITNIKLATDSVDFRVLAPNAVGEENIGTGSVSITKLDTTGTPAPDKFLNGDMEWVVPEQPPPSGILAQTVVTANRYLDFADVGGHLYHPEFHDTQVVLSIPDHDLNTLLMPIGSTIRIINLKNDVVLRIDNGTLYLLGSLSTGTAVKAAAFGSMLAIKLEDYKWTVDGTGLSVLVDPGDLIPPYDFVFPDTLYVESFDFEFEG